jgi:hypothetical protein
MFTVSTQKKRKKKKRKKKEEAPFDLTMHNKLISMDSCQFDIAWPSCGSK